MPRVNRPEICVANAIRGHSTLRNEMSCLRQHDYSIRAKCALVRYAWLDEGQYTKGRKVSDAEPAEVVIKRNSFHCEWNYEIYPSRN